MSGHGCIDRRNADLVALTEKVSELCQDRDTWKARAIDAEARAVHAEEWYATRHEALMAWAREHDGPREIFAIIANGTPSPYDPPTYAQQMNALKYRVGTAEAKLAAAESRLESALSVKEGA